MPKIHTILGKFLNARIDPIPRRVKTRQLRYG